MQLIKVAAAVLNQTPLDWDGNKRNMLAAIEAARAGGASLLCLPEMCITGYGCEDAFHGAGVHDMAHEVLLEMLPATHGLVVSFGLPCEYRGALYNTACLAVDGQIAGLVGKQHLCGEGIHYEPRWFKRWPAGAVGEVEIGARTYPLGDLLIECDDVLIGFEICEDAWVADRPGVQLARRGVDLILNPSASHFAFGKHDIRHRFVLEGSRAFGVGYVYANLLGNEAGRAIYDGGAIIADSGRLLAEGPRFSFADHHVTFATIDVQATRLNRARAASFAPEVSPGERSLVRVNFEFPATQPLARATAPPAWERGPHLMEEEFTRAVSLALFDYLRKSGSRGYIVSLSGGADSSAVATLCALSVRLGTAELGRAAYLAKLRYLDQLGQAGVDDDALVRQLLTCVYQATRHSSTRTREAARDVALALGAEFIELDVDPLAQGYVDMVSQAVGRTLTWQHDDLALQNIQARARAPGIWLLANLRNALLLATSNRSEAAVGYTTMDGDTSGGLSPIAGIDKAFLRHWLRWMEHTGPGETGPLPALAAVNVQEPTAELRPADELQTDEGDLMPYDLLDEIERAAIRDKLTPLDIYLRIKAGERGYADQQLLEWIERFFRLWSRNQWKRERYAPSFHLDDENLDPKTWCRFPILSGGFARELARLREYVKQQASCEP